MFQILDVGWSSHRVSLFNEWKICLWVYLIKCAYKRKYGCLYRWGKAKKKGLKCGSWGNFLWVSWSISTHAMSCIYSSTGEIKIQEGCTVANTNHVVACVDMHFSNLFLLHPLKLVVNTCIASRVFILLGWKWLLQTCFIKCLLF